jgi:lipopolysaccharide/colanic/teichoic acid biosynthesis glycosyltransferase
MRRHRWLSPLIQLAIAILICVVIPFLIETSTLPQGWHEPQARHTAIAALAALMLGFWLHRSVGELPGTQESSGILPGYLMSFGLILTIILLFRISYSRAILSLSVLLAIGWFFLVYVITQRRTRLALGVVAGGRTDLFENMPGVRSKRLSLERWPVGVDAVTADFRLDHSDQWQTRLTDFVLAGIPVYHSKDLYESLTGRAELEHLSENNFGALGPQSSLLVAKHLVDRVTALPALIVLLPLLAVTALAIRIDSPGPVLFRQKRTGYRGRDFTVFKFRTMVVQPHPVSGEAESEPDRVEVDRFITREKDCRITRIGAILRRSRIDELPQIVNILLGEMSWIGPRPEASALSGWYRGAIPFYRYRYVVRPGITGWAQVNQGHVTDVDDVRTKLQFDFYYIRNFSVWLDLLIIAKTIKTVLTGFGHR